MSYIKTNHIQEFLMIMSEGPGVAILKFLTFAKKGILYYEAMYNLILKEARN